MDQSYAMSSQIEINAVTSYGSPVYVAVGWAVPFTVTLGPHCRYLFWRSLELKTYWIIKFLVRQCLRIPKGIKGPSWL